MLKTLHVIVSAGALVVTSANAYAVTINEIGDAGQTIDTAQIVGGVQSGDNILGSLTQGDVDLYRFTIAAGVLTVNTFTGPQVSDPQLFLFDSAGDGIGENDDAFGGGFQSEISLNLGAGTYHLGISVFDNDPLNSSALEVFSGNGFFIDLNNNTIQAPNTTNALLDSWITGFSGTGNYNITFVAATAPELVVEPTTLMLFGLGLITLAYSRIRRPSSSTAK